MLNAEAARDRVRAAVEFLDPSELPCLLEAQQEAWANSHFSGN